MTKLKIALLVFPLLLFIADTVFADIKTFEKEYT